MLIPSWRQAVVAALLLSSSSAVAGPAKGYRRHALLLNRADGAFGGQQGSAPLAAAITDTQGKLLTANGCAETVLTLSSRPCSSSHLSFHTS